MDVKCYRCVWEVIAGSCNNTVHRLAQWAMQMDARVEMIGWGSAGAGNGRSTGSEECEVPSASVIF